MAARTIDIRWLAPALIGLAAVATGCNSSKGTSTAVPTTATSATAATEINTLDPGQLRTNVTRRGTCFSPSSATRRVNAWRCSVTEALANGANLIDPCYSANVDSTSVACPTNYPPGLDAVEIELERAPGCGEDSLCVAGNAEDGATAALTVVLEDGTKCSFIAGATFAIGDARANFACADGSWLIGVETIRVDGAWTYERTPPGTDANTSAGYALTTVAAKEVWLE
jgi:hypothetical protein